MIDCLLGFCDARAIKRELIASLLTDPCWKPVSGNSRQLQKGKVTVSTENGSVWVDGAYVQFPPFGRCCVKRAARRAVLKRLSAAI